MTDTPSKTTTRRPDCVTEIRMGNTVLTVSAPACAILLPSE